MYDKLDFENYIFENEIEYKTSKKLVLVIYDIVDNKKRTKFVKFLEKYGVRVQKSAFERIIILNQYNELISKIPYYISEEDNIRVYKLKVDGEVVSWGSGMSQAEEVIIL